MSTIQVQSRVKVNGTLVWNEWNTHDMNDDSPVAILLNYGWFKNVTLTGENTKMQYRLAKQSCTTT